MNPTNPVAACLVVPNELEIAAGSPGGERVNSLLKRGADPNEGVRVRLTSPLLVLRAESEAQVVSDQRLGGDV